MLREFALILVSIISIIDGGLSTVSDGRECYAHRQRRTGALRRFAPMRACRDARALPAASRAGRNRGMSLDKLSIKIACSETSIFPSNKMALLIGRHRCPRASAGQGNSMRVSIDDPRANRDCVWMCASAQGATAAPVYDSQKNHLSRAPRL